jgi:hypothetical protein
MGVLYTYTGIKKNPDTDGIVADVLASGMDNKRISKIHWDADYPSSPAGTLKILWNSDIDWLGKTAATTQDGVWNTDLSDKDKLLLDAIILTRAPYL